MADRLVYFFLRCRNMLPFSTLEAAHGVSRAALCADFNLILDALYSFLVEDSDAKLTNRAPYDVDELMSGAGQIPVPSIHLHERDPSPAA